MIKNAVEFRLFSFSNVNNERETGFLLPEGSIIFQSLGFPVDFEDITCIPSGPVSFWKTTNITFLDDQWYYPVSEITREEIPCILDNTTKINDFLCHTVRPDKGFYPLSSLLVNRNELQLIAFLNKKLLFRRLGNEILINLENVPNKQKFTLAVEWSTNHIEARVTWREGKSLDKYYSGKGVEYENIENYTNPKKGEAIQYKARKDFEFTTLPSDIVKILWYSRKNNISDFDAYNKPFTGALAPRRFYENENDLFETVINIINKINTEMDKCKPTGYWDKNTPKTEPDTGQNLFTHLLTYCDYKNIKISLENQCRSGKLDFLFSATTEKFDDLKIALELKNAHSKVIFNGLIKQLPTYMSELEVNKGIYCVLWYKGKNFVYPIGYTTKEELFDDLSIKNKSDNIVIILLDLSFRVQASKLK